jgi:UDP-glucose 4-epimerase
VDRTLVTGGAGFIGSHIVDKLIFNGNEVNVLDNLSTGNISNLSNCINNKKLYFFNADLENSEIVKEALKDVETVFHIAAYPEVRSAFNNPLISYRQNIRNTFRLLEEIRTSKVKTVLFPSSSTIYGEPEAIPTAEDYGPLLPISLYGASKLACEALLSSYCHNYGIDGRIFRLANVVGSRSSHGVIIDFIKKLKINNKKLEILGDGLQSKSYIHITDCIECLFFCFSKCTSRIEIFNVGSCDKVDVISIARTVCNIINLGDVELVIRPALDNGIGWIGDVKIMQLDISKLKKLGWRPRFSSIEAVTLASKELLKDLEV